MPAKSATSVFFDFSDRAKFRVRGNDKLRFLNGQLTNDVRKATESKSVEAAVLNAKGKMDAHLFLHVQGDNFCVDADSELRHVLPSRLERYIIADDVEIEDVTDRLSIYHILGGETSRLSSECKIIAATRFREPGLDLWMDAAGHDEFLRQLSERFTFCDAGCAETLRVEQGIPRWGRELTPEIIPVEANLEERAIDYQKGCYIGQETISRMKMSGQRNKSLCGLALLDGGRLRSGMRLVAPGDDRKDVGWVTSVAQSERIGRQIALGYVKRGFSKAAARLEAVSSEAAQAGIALEVVDLPFGE